MADGQGEADRSDQRVALLNLEAIYLESVCVGASNKPSEWVVNHAFCRFRSTAIKNQRVGPGDAVFTTPFTFIATAEVISVLGATPVFVDIDPETFNIDPEQLQEAQLLNYLKATKYEIGLLVNFTHPKAEIKRFVL